MSLPVREIVLYKHGVGFFVRQGQVSGSQFAVTFRREDVNDILKSLVVFDQAGGQVLGIDYQTPQDTEARLGNSSIRLSENESIRDLIRRLRGRRVEINTNAPPAGASTFTGRMIGLDEVFSTEIYRSAAAVQLDDGQARVVPLSDIVGIKILDALAESDLSYFLDTSIIEDSRRLVNVHLSEGEHDIVIYYVAPSPTWRVSYRLVAESADDSQTGAALLQGWGLFDNRLEEDLNEVKVTLVAGQPISFIYDLYTSKIPVRPTVRDEARIAPGPVEYSETLSIIQQDAIVASSLPRKAGMSRSASEGDFFASAPTALPASAPRPKRADIAQSTAADTQATDLGEFFQYTITSPVTVKRGDSALVPITNSEIKYSRELLYNAHKLPLHPVAALRFTNTTGLTLERGPITVVEDGDYKGEAMVPFVKESGEVYLPYAVELGVRITEHFESTEQTIRLRVDGGYLRHDIYRIETYTYTLENTTSRSLTILLEAPIMPRWELFETPLPDAKNAAEQRWKVSVQARQSATFIRKQRTLIYTQEELTRLSYQALQHYLENKWLDRAAFDQLRALLDSLSAVQSAEREREKVIVDRGQVYEEQNQLRANIGALQSAGAEAELRARMMNQLATSQDRLEAMAARLVELDAVITSAQVRADQIIHDLGNAEPR